MAESDFLIHGAWVVGGFVGLSALGFWLIALYDRWRADCIRRARLHPAE